MTSVSVDSPLRCQWATCTAVCLSDAALYKHLCSVHAVSKNVVHGKFVCKWPDCDMRPKFLRSNKRATEHLRAHTDFREFVCPVATCGEAYKYLHTLVRHRSKGHEQPHDSDSDSAEDDADDLNARVSSRSATIHALPQSLLGSEPPVSEAPHDGGEDNARAVLSCEYCPRKFIKLCGLVMHRKAQHREEPQAGRQPTAGSKRKDNDEVGGVKKRMRTVATGVSVAALPHGVDQPASNPAKVTATAQGPRLPACEPVTRSDTGTSIFGELEKTIETQVEEHVDELLQKMYQKVLARKMQHLRNTKETL